VNPLPPDDLQISSVPAADRAAALDLAFSHLDGDESQRQVESIMADTAVGRLALDGLFGAYRDGRLIGALFAQLQAGRAATLWLPRAASPGRQPGDCASNGSQPRADARGSPDDRLLDAACDWFQRSGVRIAQVLLESASPAEEELLSRWNFSYLADLLYLVSLKEQFPASQPVAPLDFEPYCEANHERLARVVDATYAGTRDCPAINGVRHIDDVLAGYRATGEFDPRRWLLARQAGRDVGCLLLADHPQHENLELVYMGVMAAERGHGWGMHLARHAQWMARQAGRPRLVLAVDAANEPAIAAYAAAGFQAWDRRRVYLRVFS
jgi:ribosomal protein S18 acetylase RimI-like enzyme